MNENIQKMLELLSQDEEELEKEVGKLEKDKKKDKKSNGQKKPTGEKGHP